MTISTVAVTNADTTLYTATGSDLVTTIELANVKPILANASVAPTEELTGSIFRLDTQTPVHANWDAAGVAGDTVRYNGTVWLKIADAGVTNKVVVNIHKRLSGQGASDANIVDRAITIDEGNTYVYDVVSFLKTGDILSAKLIDPNETLFGQGDIVYGTTGTNGLILKATTNVSTPTG